MNEELLSVLMSQIETLPERQRIALELRYGLNGNEQHTWRKIGDRIGTSGETARQHCMKAYRMLRHPKRFQPLQEKFFELSAIVDPAPERLPRPVPVIPPPEGFIWVKPRLPKPKKVSKPKEIKSKYRGLAVTDLYSATELSSVHGFYPRVFNPSEGFPQLRRWERWVERSHLVALRIHAKLVREGWVQYGDATLSNGKWSVIFCVCAGNEFRWWIVTYKTGPFYQPLESRKHWTLTDQDWKKPDPGLNWWIPTAAGVPNSWKTS